jgi:hypothetical protein
LFVEQEVNLFSVAAKNYGRRMLSSSFNYVVLGHGAGTRVEGKR